MSGPLQDTPTLPPVSCQLLEVRFGSGVPREGGVEPGAEGSGVPGGDEPPCVGVFDVVVGGCGDVEDPPCRGLGCCRFRLGFGDEGVCPEVVGSGFTTDGGVAAERGLCASSIRTSVWDSVLGALDEPSSSRDTAPQAIVAARAVATVQLVTIRKRRASAARV